MTRPRARRASRARDERAHLRHQHRLRPLRVATIPEELTKELQLRLLRSHACGVGEPYPDEVVRAAMLLRANTLAKATRARGPRPPSCCSRAYRGVLPHVPSRAPSAPPATSRRSRTSRCRWSARARPGSRASCPAAADALPRTARAGRARQRRRASRSINGTQFMAAMGASRSGAPVGSRAPRTSPARLARRAAGSRTSFLPQIHALRPLPGQADVRRERPPPARGLGDHRVAPQLRQGAGRVLAALRAAGARRVARPPRLRRLTVAVEMNAATDNPLVFVDDELLVSNGNFHGQPLALASTRWRWRSPSSRASPSAASSGSSTRAFPTGLPAFLTPDGGLNSRLHDPAVRGRVARQREQGALPSGERRLDPDERRAGGSRVHGERVRAEGAGRCSPTPSACWRSSCSPACAGGRVPAPLEPGAGAARRAAFVRDSFATAARRPAARRRHRAPSPPRSATVALAAVEARSRALR